MPLARALAAFVLVTSACSRDPARIVRPDDRERERAPLGAAASPRVAQVSLGRYHACSVLSDGVVRCVGRNDYGQLGDGTVEDRGRPVRVAGLSDAIEVAVGDYHTCARRLEHGAWSGASSGASRVLCWGYNAAGQLGDGLRVDRAVPWPVLGLDAVEELALGAHHSCARAVDGGVWCWGHAADGELGDGGSSDQRSPVAVRLPNGGARRVVAGSYHTCAIGMAGELRCWGSNMAGQLGDGTMDNRATPAPVRGLARVSEVALGFAHTCARTEDGAMSCFGANFQGQLGDGTHEVRLEPTPTRELRGRVIRMALGFSHTCALFDDGRARCLGEVPPAFERELRGVSGLTVGGPTTCLALVHGAVRCDGWELYRQLFLP